jgi:hypothetical protein
VEDPADHVRFVQNDFTIAGSPCVIVFCARNLVAIAEAASAPDDAGQPRRLGSRSPKLRPAVIFAGTTLLLFVVLVMMTVRRKAADATPT